MATLAIAAGGCGSDDEGTSTVGESPVPTSTEPEPLPPPPAPAPGNDPTGADRPPVGDGRGGVELAQIGSFDAPLYVTGAPGSEDIFVVEQGGKVIRVEPGGATSTFLDVSDQISSGGERGLLSVAFSPEFQRDGRFYVDFTDEAGNTRVVEYRSDSGSADPGSRRDLLRIEQPFSNHNGGLLEFGPDGLLYVGTGDGGSAEDPQRNAQNLSSLLGKLLRIDPRPQGERPYGVPKSNPFAGKPDARGEIYSYGLRNPWRYSFDRNTGWLSIGDVGQNSFEEVDLLTGENASGANFGWSAFEGNAPLNTDQSAPGAVPPVLTYPTADGNCSVTGGYVVRDERLASLYGRYLYGDFCAGQLRSFVARPGRKAAEDRELGLEVENLSSFGEDNQGRIYATSINGPVYRLDPAG